MKKLQNESLASDFIGRSFVVFPRSVFGLLFLSGKKEQSAGILYTALLSKVFFVKGSVRLKDKIFSCDCGECITSHQELFAYCGLPERSYYKALKWLVEMGLVKTVRLLGVTRFYLPDYVDFYKKAKSSSAVDKQASLPLSIGEAERRIGGRSMQFMSQSGRMSGKEQL